MVGSDRLNAALPTISSTNSCLGNRQPLGEPSTAVSFVSSAKADGRTPSTAHQVLSVGHQPRALWVITVPRSPSNHRPASSAVLNGR